MITVWHWKKGRKVTWAPLCQQRTTLDTLHGSRKISVLSKALTQQIKADCTEASGSQVLCFSRRTILPITFRGSKNWLTDSVSSEIQSCRRDHLQCLPHVSRDVKSAISCECSARLPADWRSVVLRVNWRSWGQCEEGLRERQLRTYRCVLSDKSLTTRGFRGELMEWLTLLACFLNMGKCSTFRKTVRINFILLVPWTVILR